MIATESRQHTNIALALTGSVNLPCVFPPDDLNIAFAVYDDDADLPREPTFAINMDGSIYLRGQWIGCDEVVAKLIATSIRANFQVK